MLYYSVLRLRPPALHLWSNFTDMMKTNLCNNTYVWRLIGLFGTDLRSLFTLPVKKRVSLGTNLILSQLSVTCSEEAINLFSSPGSEEQRAIHLFTYCPGVFGGWHVWWIFARLCPSVIWSYSVVPPGIAVLTKCNRPSTVCFEDSLQLYSSLDSFPVWIHGAYERRRLRWKVHNAPGIKP